MRRLPLFIIVILVLGAAQLACNLPTMVSSTPGPGTAVVSSTPTLPPIITATPDQNATKPAATTAATQANAGGTCSYKVTYLQDVTIPDNTTLQPGQSFVKTWRVRNDGTCTWGPTGHALHAIAHTSGDSLGAPEEVALPSEVKPGETVDVSVPMKAPTSAGTYLSNWLFRIDGDPSGKHWVGIGASGDQPLYALIKVASSSGNSGNNNNNNTGGSANTSRVQFESGATSAVVTGQIGANERKGYVLSAMKDQVMLVNLSSPSNDVKVKITAANGASLTGYPDTNSGLAMAYLPSTQDYTVWVIGGGSSANFQMDIQIPSRITFQQGATEATVKGTIRNQRMVTYVLRASAGQTMKVNLIGEGVGLTIYGLSDGQPLKRSSVGDNTFSYKLTMTQDYIISVDPRVESTTYTLVVQVE